MARYADLKQERDDAVERAVIAERNSQLERVRELESAHAAERAELLTEIGRLEAELVRVQVSFQLAVEQAARVLRESLGPPDRSVTAEATAAQPDRSVTLPAEATAAQ